MSTYTGVRLTIDITAHDLTSVLKGAHAFLDEIEEFDEPARGRYTIGRDGALPIGSGVLADVEIEA